MIPKVGLLNLGCPRNLVDSEAILGRLKNQGCQVVDLDKADIGIVNTCAFVNDAKKESIDAVLDLIDLKKRGKLKKIIVTGCLVQRYKRELSKQLPEVDAFVGGPGLNNSKTRFAITPGHYGYLKICESCVNNCSFCVIPKIKGKFFSFPAGRILERVGQFNKEKISELNIIGQDISGYGLDLYGKRSLAGLLRKIVKKSGNIGWIRLLYLYPGPMVKELIELIRVEPKICRYFDLPIQHINDRILKLMNRRTSKKDILELIRLIRNRLPEAAIRTSLIAGFPSETDKEFKELLNFIEEAKFERLGVFLYSQEEGTRAFDLKGQVPEKIKISRFNALMSSQQAVSKAVNEKFLGKEMELLIDEKDKDFYLARSQYDAPEVDGLVYLKSKKRLKPGDFVKAKITDTLEYDLVGEILN